MAKKHPRNPYLTVDVIVRIQDKLVLIERKNPPFGWALPGGFVDYGESVEMAAMREAMEEIQLDVVLDELLYVYSEPSRDPRQHVTSVVFLASAQGTPCAADDAKKVALVSLDALPENLCFDHAMILSDYRSFCERGVRPSPLRALQKSTERERNEPDSSS